VKAGYLRLLAACLAVACGGETAGELPPLGQIVLYVTTDAPLPAAAGQDGDTSAPPPLFDRLLIEVFPPDANEPCSGCRQTFELDRESVRESKVSFGIVPRAGVSGYRARARLYRAITEKAGEPPQLSTIDTWAALPKVGHEGIVRATITLRVADMGKTLGSASDPLPIADGAPAPLAPWPNAERRACTGTARSAEACVPGGAFWMGHPYAGGVADGTDASQSRLVTLSPFYVDLHEVTVGEFRASGLALLEDGSSVDPVLGPVEGDGLSVNVHEFFCTYSDVPLVGAADRENLPVSCVSWSAANAYCAAQGKRLPSEAELEYLSGRLRSELFVWGQSDAVGCADSVWGRAGAGYFMSYDECRAPDDVGGPLPAGNGALDRLPLPEGEVVDLMGNVAEWTTDYWNRAGESCWAGHALLENPICDAPGALDSSDPPLRTVKGTDWSVISVPAATRYGRIGWSAQRGFRCVRPAGAEPQP
jgi:formylglycine-generating enzyme